MANNGYYDKEDDVWHFVESIEDTFEKEIDIPISIEVSFDLETKDYDICVDTVNNGQIIELEYDIHGVEKYK